MTLQEKIIFLLILSKKAIENRRNNNCSEC
jgi:hypothetical protein